VLITIDYLLQRFFMRGLEEEKKRNEDVDGLGDFFLLGK
jgi:hypothetical protein